jgi:hypothetical protein
MLNTLINVALGFGRNRVRSAVIAAGTLAGLAGMPTAAFAHHHGFHVDVIVPGEEVVVPAPACEAVPTQVWVAPVYRTVTERIWVEPVTTTQIQRVDVPAEYGWRDVVFYDYFGREHIRREQVEISPARCEERAVQVVVVPGHFEEQTHQQLVCDGHFETRYVQPQPPVTVVQPADVRLEIPLPF